MSSLFDGAIECAASLIQDGVHDNPEYLRGMAELIAVMFDLNIANGRELVIDEVALVIDEIRQVME